MRLWARAERDRGSVLVITAGGLSVLLVVAALVVDLAAVRVNRNVARTAADTAASAGAFDITFGDGQIACETAAGYLALSIPGVSSFAGLDCTGFPLSCGPGTPATTTAGTSGAWRASITYPVPDDHPLMDASTLGSGSQATVALDALRCDRIGVVVRNTHESWFARVIGADRLSTNLHAVARSIPGSGEDIALNLLVLERYDCDAISASGSGGGTGGIVVDAVFNPNTGELDPGFAAADSDASGSCGGDGVIDVNGANAFIRADGPAGCATQSGTHVGAGGLLVGEGCGQILSLAPGTPGCNYPACTSSGTVAPDPTAMSRRITRAPVDHRYNCKASYPMPFGWDIDGCNDSPDPNIDQLAGAYGGGGTPPGFSRWTVSGPWAAEPDPCSIDGPPGTEVIVPPGRWRIDCPQLNVRRTLVFQAGDVIFDGDVSLTSFGVLALNADPAGGPPYSPDSSAAVAFMRDGRISKAGDAEVYFHHTTLYLSDSSRLTMQGGAGALVWTAPTSGDFEDLALWSESGATHDLAGQASLNLEGVFFAPWGHVKYRGIGAQEQVSAQFISRTLASEGQGLLVVRPTFDRAVLFPATPDVQIIR